MKLLKLNSQNIKTSAESRHKFEEVFFEEVEQKWQKMKKCKDKLFLVLILL